MSTPDTGNPQEIQLTATLYDQAGGWKACQSLADMIVLLIGEDDLLAEKFADVDLTKHRVQLALFFQFILGGTDRYDGRTMEQILEDAHLPLELDDGHFTRLSRIVVAALWLHHGLNVDLIRIITEKVTSLRPLIVAARIRARRQATAEGTRR
jgi:truncated hemoglobin YjbI